MSELTTETSQSAVAEVIDWLRDRVAAQTGRPAAEIDPDVPLNDYGLDSVYLFGLSAEIEDHYGIEVEATIMWDNTSLAPLADALMPLIAAR
ncbi:polyketide synthase [Streptomyces sp. CNQ-509]|uniref:acyl carrier protein n=1 Tax=unclassified Streptomyces TaxID=2593676 RepID=UPI00062DE05B|nr:acyl carrier protein [Streptomyces sp. CNQ-509]AKH81529.1 polyketide synthase [Streptomyces sp. CNQ-509]